MIVIDREPHGWFLLQDGDDFYLDVSCSVSLADFSVLILLNSKERSTFARQGRQAIVELAVAIQYSPNKFEDRDVSGLQGLEVTDAVVAWRGSSVGS